MPATQTTETGRPVSNTKQISRKEMSLKQYEASIREELMSISTLLQDGVEGAYKMTRKLLVKGVSVEEITELTGLPIDEIECIAARLPEVYKNTGGPFPAMPATQTTETDKPVSNTKQISRKEMSLEQYIASLQTEFMRITALLRDGVEGKYKITRKLLAKGASVEEIAELTELPINEIKWLATHPSEMGESLSEGEAARMRYEARQLYIMDELDSYRLSRDEGIVEGENKKAIETVRNLFKMGFSVEQIAKGTELSIEEVEMIKTQKGFF